MTQKNWAKLWKETAKHERRMIDTMSDEYIEIVSALVEIDETAGSSDPNDPNQAALALQNIRGILRKFYKDEPNDRD